MTVDAAHHTLLLLHDGELADVRAIAVSVGAGVIENLAPDAPVEWDVLITTPRYARSDHLAGARPKAVRITVIDRNSRTLRTLLRRSGVDLVVRRPVHPTALRLLLIHSLYRGPERRSRRVAVGAPVRFRFALRKRDAVLADLSMRGCLLLSHQSARVGQAITIWIPDAATDGGHFALRGAIIRTLVTENGERGFGVEFGKIPKASFQQLKAAVAAHLHGPAAGAREVVSPAIARSLAAPPGEPVPDPGSTQPIAYRESSIAACAAETVAAVAIGETVCDPSEVTESRDTDERRGTARHAYAGRRVVALGEQAARVLIGRDLSVGGMRIDRAPDLEPGQVLQLAIHVSAGETPLVVTGEIVRDDGEYGFALRFRDLSVPAERYLAKMVGSLPVLAAGDSGAGLVVSEIVERDA